MSIKSLTRVFANRCWEIAEVSADRNGFVPLRKVLDTTQCHLIATPLLVEAAITTRIDNPSQWVVLINSEVHEFGHEDFEMESSISPIKVRTRNTVAHEVAHKIAIDVFGMDVIKKGTMEERLFAVEQTIERISPLLLIPKSKLLNSLSGMKNTDESLYSFSKISRKMGVSRQVFISSLKLLNQYHRSEVIKIQPFSNALWGVADFQGKNKFVTRAGWALQNFQESISSEAAKIIQKKLSIQWDIISVNDSNKTLVCEATSKLLLDGIFPVKFEIERIPPSNRGKSFYRLPGIQSRPETGSYLRSDQHPDAGPALLSFIESLK